MGGPHLGCSGDPQGSLETPLLTHSAQTWEWATLPPGGKMSVHSWAAALTWKQGELDHVLSCPWWGPGIWDIFWALSEREGPELGWGVMQTPGSVCWAVSWGLS